MAKVPSPFLTGATGKFAGAAFQQSPGNGTILREVVKPTNPSTEAQVEQRAKFKLMSQVATAFKSVIAMKREGNITPRNMFVKINSPLLTFDSAQSRAEIELAKLQLTKSAQQIDNFDGSFDEAKESIELTMTNTLPILYGGVFVHIRPTENTGLIIKAIARETVNEAANSISHTFENAEVGDVFLAYGITQDTAGLAVKYGDIEGGDAQGWLNVLSDLAQSSSLTKTSGFALGV